MHLPLPGLPLRPMSTRRRLQETLRSEAPLAAQTALLSVALTYALCSQLCAGFGGRVPPLRVGLFPSKRVTLQPILLPPALTPRHLRLNLEPATQWADAAVLFLIVVINIMFLFLPLSGSLAENVHFATGCHKSYLEANRM